MQEDFFLDTLVASARINVSFGIILCVGGVIITGDLANEDEYFEGI